ncbi:MAG: double-strand break repair helicase AddA [Kordiimonadaceae bacterium]|nr:double-strand break repair helicase AddA [Kordiimonadaceae bacterium]MBO6567946.1 double-strand break repair helicase AddA [Kordiimonadaceae bacterium]MBO6964324.1 double-strand break repair helicase AddA [Kordiimonadaceae bacterium]
MSSGGATGMTPEQAYATHPSLTAWVGASAGTGKTHVLTARVLRLLVTGTPPENILCLTFTKAAAAEMKNRIFAELGTWSTLSDEVLQQEIFTRTGEQADADILKRARQLFTRVLDLSGGFQIVTFHSFCQSLLGRFPLEAGMTPGFEGIDENDAIELMASARDRMLAATQQPLSLALKSALGVVAGKVTENTFDEVMDRLIFEAPELTAALRAFRGMEGLIKAVHDVLGADTHYTDEQLIRSAADDTEFNEAGLVQLAEALLGGSAGDKKRGDIILSYVGQPKANRADLVEHYKAAFLTKSGTPLKTVATKAVLNNDDSLLGIIEAEQDRLLDLEDKRKRLNAATATSALLRLGIEQLSLYRFVKNERGLVDFDDMIDRTVTLFSQSDIAPWILYKLDHQIDHILVDEAQDTNPDQWRVVETLAAEFFSGETARDVTRTIFAVGDAKQSIFSFQRADPTEFVRARDRVFARAREANAQVGMVPLDTSFRSGEAVLALVDAVFASNGAAFAGLSPDAEEIRHSFARIGQGGHVELWPLVVAEGRDIVETDEWQPPVEQETINDAERSAAIQIADHIATSIGSRKLASKGRPVRAGDIMVLVRRRTQFVDHLIRALKARNIPVSGRDRMSLLDELPVMDLLALAQFALLPDDDLALATVLKSPLAGLDDDHLFEIAHGRTGSLWQRLLEKQEHWPSTVKFLKRTLARVDMGGPFDFFSFVLVELQGREKLNGRLGREIDDALDEFLEQAMSFQLRKASSLLSFCENLKRSNAQIKRDMEQAGDQIRIMTTHSAKGLQAPIVYLSDVTSVPDLSRDGRLLSLNSENMPGLKVPVWASQGRGLPEVEVAREALLAKQLAEYRRLLYVALTRAEDELYVAGWRGSREPSKDCWYNLVAEGFDRLSATEIKLPDGREVVRYHVDQIAEVKQKPQSVDVMDTSELPPTWINQKRPEEPTPNRPLSPSRPEEEEAVFSPLSPVRHSIFKRGNLLHQLLQWLPDIPAAGRDAAAKVFMEKHKVSETDRRAFLRETLAVLEDPEFAPIFGPGSRAEVPIAGVVPSKTGGDPRTVSGQLDRLVVTDTDVLIIDYKTNRPPPVSVDLVPQVYLRQMGLYARVLEGIYPDKSIQCALLWTDEARLMRLPNEALEKALVNLGL